MTADAGYEIADVTVDGQSVGAVAEYTFQDVTRNHTIHAAFQPAGSVMFDNDFEDDAFPGRGWRVKTTNADYTWTSARMSQLTGGGADRDGGSGSALIYFSKNMPQFLQHAGAADLVCDCWAP